METRPLNRLTSRRPMRAFDSERGPSLRRGPAALFALALAAASVAAGAPIATVAMLPAATAPDVPGPYTPVRIIDDPEVSEVRVADLDDDGREDILTVSADGGAVAWWETAGFDRVAVTDGTHPVEMASPGDFNGDGCLDVLTFEPTTRMLRVWRNGTAGGLCTGDYTLADQLLLTTGPFQQVAAGELDGDGLADYLMVEADAVRPPTDFLFAVNGGGALTGFAFYMGGFDQGARRLKVADLDGDACPDVAGVTGPEVAWWRRLRDGSGCVTSPVPVASFAAKSTIGSAEAAGETFVDAAVADLDGDGRLDVAALSRYVPDEGSGDEFNRVYAWLGEGVAGTFESPASLLADTLEDGIGAVWGSLDAGDVDADGDADLVVAGAGEGEGSGGGVWALVNGASPWATATPTATSESTPTETPDATSVATSTVEPTGTAEPTGTEPAATTTPTTAPTATATLATVGPTASHTATPTVEPLCTPLADVGLVAPAGNAAEARLLSAVLDEHAAAWSTDTGRTLVHRVHVYDERDGETYDTWLAERLATGFVEPGFCAARILAVVGDNELSKHAGRFVNLRPLADGSPPLPDFLDYAWTQVHLPDAAGDPYALPWMRDGCSESYRNLALVESGGDAGVALDLMRRLAYEPSQFLNYMSRDADTGARLAFPTIRGPYEGGWIEFGGVVECDTSPPAAAPDPALVDEAIHQARRSAARLEPVLERDYRFSRYSHGADPEGAVYDSVERPGGADFLASSAVSLRLRAPLTGAEAAEFIADDGLVLGQISFYAPGGLAVTPTVAPPTPPAIPTRPGRIMLPSLFESAAVSPSAPSSPSPFMSYAVLLEQADASARAWLVRPDGSRADAADVARDLGLAPDAIEFEAVDFTAEPRLGSAVWSESGSKKTCWGLDGIKWCLSKK